MVHIIELVGQPKVEFAQQVTMNRALQLKPAESESRSAFEKVNRCNNNANIQDVQFNCNSNNNNEINAADSAEFACATMAQ
ncbi:uncharacterized protein LOC118738808 [Rhagoletis pomonella]|uniref:uncharacterized protein LOC118738808 n=1 Tax=Rhagoletis pomonella TaxID=28610 RepID=UPI001783D49D|nr:uncharacterized protein LOC118738808 [Rhagoletis pomonella]XP_036325692.1 uncharacterized protein LOC118738808 [Rhagoletis pomonella]